MINKNILLDSQLAKKQSERNRSHDFTIRFSPPIELDKNKKYVVALDELITMTYSWYNIRGDYNNTHLKYRKKSEGVWKTITFPDGMYDYKDISAFVQSVVGDKDLLPLL